MEMTSKKAVEWVSKINVGRNTAKHLLLYYAIKSDNVLDFSKKHLSKQLDLGVRTISELNNYLVKLGLIKVTPRFNELGSQLTSIVELLIPENEITN